MKTKKELCFCYGKEGKSPFSSMFPNAFRHGLVVRIAGSHPAGPGSIPGGGKTVFFFAFTHLVAIGTPKSTAVARSAVMVNSAGEMSIWGKSFNLMIESPREISNGLQNCILCIQGENRNCSNLKVTDATKSQFIHVCEKCIHTSSLSSMATMPSQDPLMRFPHDLVGGGESSYVKFITSWSACQASGYIPYN